MAKSSLPLPLRELVDYRRSVSDMDYRRQLGKGGSLGLKMRRWSGHARIMTALLGSVATAQAVQVTGKLTDYVYLRNSAWQEARNPDNHRYSFREPVPTVGALERALYPYLPSEVCVALIGGANIPAPQRPVAIRLGGGRLLPTTVVVPPGTLLRFENKDPFAHRLFGVGINTFPVADTTPQSERKWAVAGAGLFEIRDELGPSVRLWVVGVPNVVASAYPTMAGEFSLTVEQPGTYTLQTYFEGKAVGAALPVEVGTRDVDLHRTPIKVAEPSKAPSPDEKSD